MLHDASFIYWNNTQINCANRKHRSMELMDLAFSTICHNKDNVLSKPADGVQ